MKKKMDFLVSQFSYLGNDCGVAFKEKELNEIIYQKEKSSENYNVLFNASKFKAINENFERNVNKIYVM